MINSNLKNANILIVDDNQSNIDVLTGFLDYEGYTNYTSTSDARKVIGLFEEFKPDLILLDLHMPHLTGFQLMEQLKPLIPEDAYLPILVLTADSTTETKLKALAVGAQDFLSKPFDLSEVELRIKNLLLTRSSNIQLKNQNLILEEKVEERTSELNKNIVELIAAKEKAEESDKLKTAFINNISHEIRTPLNGIMGFGQILAEQEFSADDSKELLEVVQNSINRLMNTVTDYMDIAMIVSKTMKAHKKEFIMEPLFDAITDEAKQQCSYKKIDFVVKIPSITTGLTVNSDPELIQKIQSKLLDNAIKFTEKGNITCGYNIVTGNIEFFVKDTGCGIDNDALDLIFEVFSQADTSMTRGYEGSGLGLSIAKGLVELLDGEINVESEKGIGSVFSFTIPIGHSEKSISPVSTNTNKTKSNNKPLILIAEDNELNFKYLEIVMKSLGYKFIHAVNGLEAVNYCKQNFEISIVLMDIKMPVMNGVEATKQIREFRPELPIIATTAFAHAGDEHRFLEAGCNDYIAKPIEKGKLLSLISKYI